MEIRKAISLITASIFGMITISFVIFIIIPLTKGTFDPPFLNMFGLMLDILGTSLIVLPEWYKMKLKITKFEPILKQKWTRIGVIIIISGFTIQMISSHLQH